MCSMTRTVQIVSAAWSGTTRPRDWAAGLEVRIYYKLKTPPGSLSDGGRLVRPGR
jgi:hypothetical protein